MAVCGPTPHRREIGSGARNDASSPGGTTTRPSGLRRSDPILATSLVRATPTEAVSRNSPRIVSLICLAIAGAVAEQRSRGGHVQEGLVDRDRLHERRESTKDRHDLATHALVGSPVHRHEDAVGAEPSSRPDGHRRVDAELPCLVRGGAHDAAVARPAHADDHRSADELRVIPLLDGREEGVEVDVQDRPIGHAVDCRPEACQRCGTPAWIRGQAARRRWERGLGHAGPVPPARGARWWRGPVAQPDFCQTNIRGLQVTMRHRFRTRRARPKPSSEHARAGTIANPSVPEARTFGPVIRGR